jgi:hypothetical protein
VLVSLIAVSMLRETANKAIDRAVMVRVNE